MATVAKNCKLYLDGFNLSADFNVMGLQTAVEPQDATTFGQGARVMEPGLFSDRVEFGGFWRAATDAPDGVLRPRLGVKDGLFMVAPLTGAEGEVAYFLRSTQGEYIVQSDTGRLVTFTGSMVTTSGPMIRGRLLLAQTITITILPGAGTQLGDVASGQRVYWMAEILSGTGNLTLTLQSADNASMLSATTHSTFGAIASRGARYASVAGPITDDYWAIGATLISGGPFVVAVAVGIL